MNKIEKQILITKAKSSDDDSENSYLKHFQVALNNLRLTLGEEWLNKLMERKHLENKS